MAGATKLHPLKVAPSSRGRQQNCLHSGACSRRFARSPRRTLQRDQVIHVHVAREPPLVGNWVIDHSGAVDFLEPAALQRLQDFIWPQKLAPIMRARFDPAQDIFGSRQWRV